MSKLWGVNCHTVLPKWTMTLVSCYDCLWCAVLFAWFQCCTGRVATRLTEYTGDRTVEEGGLTECLSAAISKPCFWICHIRVVLGLSRQLTKNVQICVHCIGYCRGERGWFGMLPGSSGLCIWHSFRSIGPGMITLSPASIRHIRHTYARKSAACPPNMNKKYTGVGGGGGGLVCQGFFHCFYNFLTKY